MKSKVIVILAGAMTLLFVMLTGTQGMAAESTGELRYPAPMFGYERWIPRVESMHSSDVLNLLYDPIVGTSPDGEFSTEYGIATKWETAPDFLSITLYLRKGVKFHDGVEVTAKDVKFTLDQVVLPDSKSGNAGAMRRIIKSVEIKDPYTVVVHCKKPTLIPFTLLYNLSNVTGTEGLIIPKHYYEKVGRDEFKKHPMGSGPYKFHSQQSGSFIKLEAIDRHWQYGVPRFKYVNFLIIPEYSSRIAMLKNGEADLIRISRESVKDMLDAGFRVVTQNNGTVAHMEALKSWESPAFSDVRFRKALNLAIDKDAIIKHIFAGLTKPYAMYPGPNLFGCGVDSTLKPYPYDPVEAKRLIKEGGWEGHEFTLASYSRSGLPEYATLVEALAGYWRKVGLKPKIFVTEYATWRQKWRAGKTSESVCGMDSGSSPNCGEQIGRMTHWYNSTKNNWSVVKLPELDAMFEKMHNSLDEAEVKRLQAKIYRYAYDNYVMMPICEISEKMAISKKVPMWDPGKRRNSRNINGLIRQQ